MKTVYEMRISQENLPVAVSVIQNKLMSEGIVADSKEANWYVDEPISTYYRFQYDDGYLRIIVYAQGTWSQFTVDGKYRNFLVKKRMEKVCNEIILGMPCQGVRAHNVESDDQLSLLTDLPLDVPDTVKNVDSKFSIYALALSIGLLVFSFISGILWIITVSLLNYTVFVNKGLRSNKRDLAIVAAVITGFSMLISLINFIAVTTTTFNNHNRYRTAAVETIKGGIETGTWSADGKVFTNEWSGLTLTLPEGYTAFSGEDLQSVLYANMDEMVNDGTISKFEAESSKLTTVYDFQILAITGIPNFILMYENIGRSPLTNSMDEAGYFNTIEKTQFEAMEELNYSVVSTSTKKVAGEDWFAVTVSIYDGAGFQDYYLHKVDGIMYALCATYSAETEDEAAAVIASIGKTS